jgi:FAD dependent oxidoreductase TIGR03364
VGCAHTLAAAKAGCAVHLYDAQASPSGASVRNFGLVFPLGAPPAAVALAARSRAVWGEAAAAARFRLDACGSLTLAHADDEFALLRAAMADGGAAARGLRLLSAREALERSGGAACGAGLVGALWSPSEAVVDAPAALHALRGWLAAAHGVTLHLGEGVRGIALPVVDGEAGALRADAAIVCGGTADAARGARALFPEVYAAAARAGALTRVRLQMLRTAPQPAGWRLGPALAGGLTLARYAAFAHLPGVAALRARLAAERPVAARHDIHVLVTQAGDGGLTIGDSHAHAAADAPQAWLDDDAVDEEILANARRMLAAPHLRIASRWHGEYLKLAGSHALVATPGGQPNVRVVNALGGAGMTLSFGLAEEVVAGLGFGATRG